MNKVFKFNKKFKKLIIKVYLNINKFFIKKILKKLFNLKINKRKIIVYKGKITFFKRIFSYKDLIKKAILFLKEGSDINIVD